jgi:hypothetical protein
VTFRNIAVHADAAAAWQIVWFAATRNAPARAKRAGDLPHRADVDPTVDPA